MNENQARRRVAASSFLSFVATLLVLVTNPGSAMSDLISESVFFGSPYGPITSGPGYLASFDPALGTLNGAVIQHSGSINVHDGVQVNSSDAAGSFQITTNYDIIYKTLTGGNVLLEDTGSRTFDPVNFQNVQPGGRIYDDISWQFNNTFVVPTSQLGQLVNTDGSNPGFFLSGSWGYHIAVTLTAGDPGSVQPYTSENDAGMGGQSTLTLFYSPEPNSLLIACFGLTLILSSRLICRSRRAGKMRSGSSGHLSEP
jgi:hypothetical protein